MANQIQLLPPLSWNSRFRNAAQMENAGLARPIQSDQPSFYTLLLYIRDIPNQTVAETAAVTTLRQGGGVFQYQKPDYRNVGNHQTIWGNGQALELLHDYDWVIDLAIHLIRGFEVNDFSGFAGINPDISNPPRDIAWVSNYLLRLLQYRGSQKDALSNAIEWASRYVMIRCRMSELPSFSFVASLLS